MVPRDVHGDVDVVSEEGESALPAANGRGVAPEGKQGAPERMWPIGRVEIRDRDSLRGFTPFVLGAEWSPAEVS